MTPYERIREIERVDENVAAWTLAAASFVCAVVLVVSTVL